ncbi:allantoate amidohydrolase [Deinococcus sp.]|uniref:allantoate amidohydrolase n=1 Tax=Deinococcus sp. TaxID=47478 RepID=UPI0025FDE378|nr:allantoate amidohydrolase [Deinococcus sp.]
MTTLPPDTSVSELSRTVLGACAAIANFTSTPGQIHRTFLSPPMRDVHAFLTGWADELGLVTRIDAAGNLRSRLESALPGAPTFYLGSHLDTVPNAGAYDGVLGVVMAYALVGGVQQAPLPFSLEIVGFSEEEGVRFGVPFIGSRALLGTAQELLDLTDREGQTVRGAVQAFGLDPTDLPGAEIQGRSLGYLELHIEQGPVLEAAGQGLGVVSAIVGQSRLSLDFVGRASHAGTTPMTLRRDALAAAAHLLVEAEAHARRTPGLVATVGSLKVAPGAANVIPGSVTCSLDLRHVEDEVRQAAQAHLLAYAAEVASQRQVAFGAEPLLSESATPMDPGLRTLLHQAAAELGLPHAELVSGAGHDAMILARRMPAAMLFLRSPGGLSHHPDEAVLEGDADAVLRLGLRFVELLARREATRDA